MSLSLWLHKTVLLIEVEAGELSIEQSSSFWRLEVFCSVEIKGKEVGIVWLMVVSTVKGREQPIFSPRVPLLVVPKACCLEIANRYHSKVGMLQSLGWDQSSTDLFVWNETTWLASDLNFLMSYCPPYPKRKGDSPSQDTGEAACDVSSFFAALQQMLLYLFRVKAWETAAFLLRRVQENTGLSLTCGDQKLTTRQISGKELELLSCTVSVRAGLQPGVSSALPLVPSGSGCSECDSVQPTGLTPQYFVPCNSPPGSSTRSVEQQIQQQALSEGQRLGSCCARTKCFGACEKAMQNVWQCVSNREQWWWSGFKNKTIEHRFSEHFNKRCSMLELVAVMFVLYLKAWWVEWKDPCLMCTSSCWQMAWIGEHQNINAASIDKLMQQWIRAIVNLQPQWAFCGLYFRPAYLICCTAMIVLFNFMLKGKIVFLLVLLARNWTKQDLPLVVFGWHMSGIYARIYGCWLCYGIWILLGTCSIVVLCDDDVLPSKVVHACETEDWGRAEVQCTLYVGRPQGWSIL